MSIELIKREHYGLWINKELTMGRSFKCDTYDNDILSLATEFEILKIEVRDYCE